MPDSLTLTDNRTGRTFELPDQGRDGPRRGPSQGAHRLRRTSGWSPTTRRSSTRRPVAAASPTSTATRASCDTAGYPIEQLAEKSSFLETAYLLLQGELPTASQLSDWTKVVHDNRVPPARIAGLFDAMAEDPHPMGA